MRAVRSCSAILKTWFCELDPRPLHDYHQRGIGKKERIVHVTAERERRNSSYIFQKLNYLTGFFFLKPLLENQQNS